MKTIVCFGDSNTWGYVPAEKRRYPFEKRWTTILQKILGDKYFVIPEGLNGRTTCMEDPVEGDKNGLTHLRTVLEVHKPIDLIVIMLGTNDLKDRFSLNAMEITTAAGRLVEYTLKSNAGVDGKSPEVLLVSPAPVKNSPVYGYMFLNAVEKSKKLSTYYRGKAEELGVYFFDAGTVVTVSNKDGIHWEETGHLSFAESIAEKIKEII